MLTVNPEHQRAKNQALALIKKYRIRKPAEIRVELLAWLEHRALIQEREVSSCAAAVVRSNRSSLIVINRHGNPGRKRFSIAHELGHLTLHSKVNQMALCSESDIFRYRKIRPEEPEANTFAVELLMPEQFFQESMGYDTPSFELIAHLREVFQTSLTSTAIRYVSLTEHPCALVFSKYGDIQWSHPSPTFRYKMREGKLHSHTFASDFTSNPAKANEAKRGNLAPRWFLNAKDDFPVIEQSKDLGRFGLLTLVSYRHDDIGEEDDEEDW